MDTDFTLDDFRKHIESFQKVGMKNMIRHVPGMAGMAPEGEDPDVALLRIQRMIDAMLPEERSNPDTINAARRNGVAAEAGVQPDEVSGFLRQFQEARTLMKEMMNMSLWQRIKLVLGIRRFPLPPPPEA